MGKKQTRQITYEEMKEYGEFFKSMRLSIGYSLIKMSEPLGVFYTTYSKWEKGLIIPQQDIYEIEEKVRNIVKVAKVGL
jgi:transcriptional regulator with XRE-family HTH domain